MRRACLAVLAVAGAACTPEDIATDTALVSVHLMSFNIRTMTGNDGDNSWPYRQDLVAETYAARSPDFVGLQEAWHPQVTYLSEQTPEYAWFGRTRDETDGYGESSAILWRDADWTRDDEEHGTFWLSETPEVPGSTGWGSGLPRIVTWARFHHASGAALYVYNTHFDHASAEARAESARLLRQRIRTRDHADPVVVLGDLNADEGSEPLVVLGRTPLVDSFRAMHPDEDEVGTYGGWQGDTAGPKIDHVLVTPDVAVRAAEIIRDHDAGRYPSDHYPVSATIQLP